MAVRVPALTTVASERRSEALAGYGFVAIPLLLFLTLNIGAMGYAVYISFWRWGLRGATEFRGLANYERLLSDEIFLIAVRNTLTYTLVWVPLTMALGLLLAVIVNQKIRGQTFFRAAFYFPAIASSVAITVLWIFLVSPEGAFNDIRAALGLNGLFEAFGFPPNHSWVSHSRTAMASVIVLNAWTTSGTVMLFYLASLQAISHEVYEAAAIDGANAWNTFWRITFPLLRPGHFFVATVLLIGGMQIFDQAYVAGGTSGDPNNALTTIVLYLYRSATKDFSFGYASAVGIVLFALIFLGTLLQRRIFGNAPSW
ncbi:MAG TPA: sugar ABC transporter permease [Candidatus Limnocylindrales bacterium]|nr:sugar ABC transporter permease [Candidatus Limnocylindrales bacterium]